MIDESESIIITKRIYFFQYGAKGARTKAEKKKRTNSTEEGLMPLINGKKLPLNYFGKNSDM